MSAVAVPGTRSFYIDDYSDEVVPCDCTLEGWADWLSKPDENWQHDTPADGEQFPGSATLWQEDIIATCAGGEWTLSRDPASDDFVAIRFCEGSGWDCDSIAGGKEGLLELLRDFADDDGVEHIACGRHEDGWIFTYRSGPPPALEAAPTQ